MKKLPRSYVFLHYIMYHYLCRTICPLRTSMVESNNNRARKKRMYEIKIKNKYLVNKMCLAVHSSYVCYLAIVSKQGRYD